MLADYFERAALAASQVLAGFKLDEFRHRLEREPVGLSVSKAALASAEGSHLADLTVRLLARLYPVMDLRGTADLDGLAMLARAINPSIELVDSGALYGIAVGDECPNFPTTISAGSEGWIGAISTSEAVPLGASTNPFGPGVAACLAAGAVFRHVFGPEGTAIPTAARFSALIGGAPGQDERNEATRRWNLEGDALLVGAGAIGNGAVWALSRSELHATLHVIDPELLDLGNLQRYVLAAREDEGRAKTDIAQTSLGGSVRVVKQQLSWAEFVGEQGYQWSHVLVALDSARDRRAVQSSLPAWIANAWTQPGDLGVSNHGPFDGPGACVSCMYLPREVRANEDAIVADALGVPHLIDDIRTLLHSGAAVPDPMLGQIAAGLRLQIEEVLQFRGHPIRSLYVDGVCGGALLPMGQTGAPASDELHVPLAHQSALAGVLLAAQLVKRALGQTPESTEVTRLDVLNEVSAFATQPALKANDGRCVCEDPDFLAVYRAKYRHDGSAQSRKH